jgi:hypothetical protein
MAFRTTALFVLLAIAGCGESHDDTDAGGIMFDANFPDTGVDAGPPPSNVGAVCSSDDECAAGGPANYCDTQLTDGYCTLICSTDDECPAGSGCISFGGGASYCIGLCEIGGTDQCYAGNGCAQTQVGTLCLPGCEDDTDCPASGTECIAGGGSFGAGNCLDPDAPLGAACDSGADCPVGAGCATEQDFDLPGGACVVQGCDPESNTGCPDDAQCLPAGFQGGFCYDGCATDDDCRAEYQCLDYMESGRLTCQPRFVDTNLGGDCDEPGTSCAGGFCLAESTNGFPDSYCAAGDCDPTAAEDNCPGDGVCAPTSDGGGLCIDGCTMQNDCRDAYECRNVDPADPQSPTACLPACTTDDQCTATTRDGTPYVCNPGTGRCTRPFTAAELGEPCDGSDFRFCRGGTCLTQADDGWPAGICVYPGCRIDGTGPTAVCPTGSVCSDDFTGDPDLGVCVDACTTGGPACRPNYECRLTTLGELGCLPACSADVCGTAATCNAETGICEPNPA